MKKIIISLIAVILISPFSVSGVSAQAASQAFTLTPNKAANFSFDNGGISVSLPDKASASDKAEIKLYEGNLPTPWNYDLISPIYQVDLFKNGLNPGATYKVSIKYEENDNYKQIFFFDRNSQSWHPIIGSDDPINNTVTVSFSLPFAQLAVLANTEVMTVGRASWYGYKGGLFTASPDFKKGTVLKVYNLDNGKSVTVTVNDYGPDRNVHPDRVVDLDKVAFSKIASLGAGVINVKIEPEKIIEPENQPVVAAQAASGPEITAVSGILVDGDTGEVLWEKDSRKLAPLASLSKIIAAKVFLDTRPTLSNVVGYSVKDEEYNYLYCNPWESAKLRVDDGETMTIEDLLYSALVGSANNAVETLVRASGLSRDAFVANMNDLVHSWGATSTHFIEPTGLSPENVSSPYEYAIIAREALSNPILKKVAGTWQYSFSTINTNEKHTLTNTNSLINSDKYNMLASKTGYLNEAGYCLMTEVRDDKGRKLIAINFNSKDKASSLSDNEQLIRYGLSLSQ